MCLTVHNQLTLLHDLLDEQMTYKTITANEYGRIKKLVQSMILSKQLDPDLLNMLPEIYYYGIKGEIAHSFPEHINENIENIQKWLATINKTKQTIH